MEYRQLKYFTYVAKLRNFTRAAESCRVAQPSLSQQVQKLERELGGPLFHRQGKHIYLTDMGEALLPKAERMLQLHSEMLREANDHASGGGVVRSGAILTIAPYLFSQVANDCAGGKALSGLELSEDFTENLLRKLTAGELDFAIMSTPVDEPALMVRVLARESFVSVMPANHKLASEKTVTLESVMSETFLPLSSIHCAGQQIRELCQIENSLPVGAIASSQIDTILRLVEKGAGLSILPYMAVAGIGRESVTVRPLRGKKPFREITLVHHQDRYLSASARALISIIEKALKKLVDIKGT